ncbi:hypothetical protein [Streptomyces sp. NPDC096013]|uniref:hypothetical protein n=1 Tax=Streptomyces sp. NPDC096013 TaxID=3366069 RepID=UPI0037F67D2F
MGEGNAVGGAVPRVSRGIEVYGGEDGAVSWSGVEVTTDVMRELGAGPWAERVGDLEATRDFVTHLRGLATTDMETEFISALLAGEPEPLPWQVGEALAEVLLEHWHGALWVWDGARDRRRRKASLPGADLVGLCVADGSARLLFGEVKSSSEQSSPPGVMTGSDGMIDQLKRLPEKNDHVTLMKWLRFRCQTPEHKAPLRASRRGLAVSPWAPGARPTGKSGRSSMECSDAHPDRPYQAPHPQGDGASGRAAERPPLQRVVDDRRIGAAARRRGCGAVEER